MWLSATCSDPALTIIHIKENANDFVINPEVHTSDAMRHLSHGVRRVYEKGDIFFVE